MNRRKTGPSRRAFLRTVGATAALSPFVPLLSTQAQEAPAPKRLLLLFTANGTINEAWKPDGGERDFQFRRILEPLQAHREDLVVLQGLRINSRGPGDGHQRGMAQLWTGAEILPGDKFQLGGSEEKVGWGGGISVDQAVANRIGDETAFRSLEFGVQTGGANIWSRMCYSGPDAPVPPEDDPYKMHERLFADVGKDLAELERIRAQQKSVIDVVRGDLDRLQSRVATEDVRKIDAHLEAIRAIERRLDLAVPSCEVPDLGGQIDVGSNDNFPDLLRLQMDLAVMAFACDSTRVASIQASRSVSNTRYTWLGLDRGHHDMSHDGDENAGTIESLTQINTWLSEQFAYLLERMKSIPEGDGTMLDNTLIVWGNELGRGNSHSRHPVPFVLAGSAAGAIETGRFLDYEDVDHNRLLVSICRAMGLDDVDTFGNTDQGSGALAGV